MLCGENESNKIINTQNIYNGIIGNRHRLNPKIYYDQYLLSNKSGKLYKSNGCKWVRIFCESDYVFYAVNKKNLYEVSDNKFINIVKHYHIENNTYITIQVNSNKEVKYVIYNVINSHVDELCTKFTSICALISECVTGPTGPTGLPGQIIDVYKNTTPGNFTTAVPNGANYAYIKACGGGGGVIGDTTGTIGAGGSAGAILDLQVSVNYPQPISGVVGSAISGSSGSDTIIYVYPYTLTASGGKSSSNSNIGGDGGSVIVQNIVTNTTMTIPGGIGTTGTGSNGNSDSTGFLYSGAAGGAGGNGTSNYNGGNIILYNGDIISGGISLYGIPGGGAGALENGGNGGNSNGTVPAENGTRGSGSGAGVNETLGGSGYVEITFRNL